MKNTVKKLMENAFVFKILYFILVLMSFNNLCANRSYLVVASYVVAAVGGLFFVYRLIYFKDYRKTKGILLLILFVLSYLLASLITFQYGVLDNIQALVWMTIQFFILYAYDRRRTVQDNQKEFHLISGIFMIYTFLVSAISLGMFFANFGYLETISGKRVIIGFLWNRLWGLYADPNFGAALSIVACVLSVYFIKKISHRWGKGLLIVNILLQVLYVALSDSRTGLVLMVCISSLLSFMYLIRNKNKRIFAKILLPVILAVVIAGASGACVITLQKAGGFIATKIQENIPGQENPGIQVGRNEQDLEGDISNRRFDIWGSAVDIFRTSPMTGVSFRNIVPYAKEHLPDTYIVSNDHADFQSMHNIFFDVLVSQGLIGVFLFLFFLGIVLIKILRTIFRQKKNYYYAVTLFCCVIAVAISSLFFSEVLYINSGGAFLFWLFLGYLMHLLNRNPQNEENSDGKKVGIFTVHRARNMGACLQVYALQTKLIELGANAVIVDYRPSFIERDFGLLIWNLHRSAKDIKGKLVYWVKTIASIPWRAGRERNFRRFRDKYYHLTPLEYLSEQEILARPPGREAYFFGSDQIWNPHITKGVCGTFYGTTVEKDAVKASYAASCGSKKFSEQDTAQVKDRLTNLEYISVREENALSMVKPLTDLPVHLHFDPTFLISTEKWESLCGQPALKEDYILVYILTPDDTVIQLASELAKKKNLPIVFFDRKNRYGCRAISKYTADPFQFISYLRGAKYVVTNSFHGTVFSILFQKQFLCVPNPSNPGRMTQLLTKLELQDRIACTAQDNHKIDTAIEYQKASIMIDEEKEKAAQYLQMVLGTEKD